MALKIEFAMPGIGVFVDNFSKSPALATKILHDALETSAVLIQRKVISPGYAPHRTGNLWRNIKYEVTGLQARVFVGPQASYAQYIERGTGLYGPYDQLIFPTKAKVFASKKSPGWGSAGKGGYFIIGKYTKGMEANPFMKRAADDSRPEVAAVMKKATDSFVAQLGAL